MSIVMIFYLIMSLVACGVALCKMSNWEDCENWLANKPLTVLIGLLVVSLTWWIFLPMQLVKFFRK